MDFRTDLIFGICSEDALLSAGEASLSLIHEVEGLGDVVADAVAFEAKASALAEIAQRTASCEDAGSLPDLEDFLGKLMKARSRCRFETGLIHGRLQWFHHSLMLTHQSFCIIGRTDCR